MSTRDSKSNSGDEIDKILDTGETGGRSSHDSASGHGDGHWTVSEGASKLEAAGDE